MYAVPAGSPSSEAQHDVGDLGGQQRLEPARVVGGVEPEDGGVDVQHAREVGRAGAGGGMRPGTAPRRAEAARGTAITRRVNSRRPCGHGSSLGTRSPHVTPRAA